MPHDNQHHMPLPWLLGGSLPFTGAGTIASGTTLPAAAKTGQLFLHTPTGRKNLMEYDGSAWCPIAGLTTITVYVDGASGSDTQNKGTATGSDAYATIQYAIDQLPALLLGNVTINVASGTYREQVTIRGKTFAGNYALTITGATTVQAGFPQTATAGANPAGNGSAGYGTITLGTASWTVNAYRNMLVEITGGTGSGQIYPIHTNSATVITIVGRWSTPPDNTSVFRVLDWGTRVTGSNGGADTTPVRDYVFRVANQRGLTLNYLRCNYAVNGGILAEAASQLPSITYCNISNNTGYGVGLSQYSVLDQFGYSVLSENGTSGLLINNKALCALALSLRIVSTTGGIGVYVQTGGLLNTILWSYVSYLGASSYQLGAENGAAVISDAYMEYEGDGDTSNNIQTISSANVYFQANFGATSTQRSLNAGGWGAFAASAGQNFDVSTITFSGNTSGTYTPVTLLAGGGS